MFNRKTRLSAKNDALPGRQEPMPLSNCHYVNGHPIKPPFPAELQTAVFGLGCFWGAERKIWQLDAIFSTAVGYAGGYTPNPNYEEICTGLTGHNEVVLAVYDPAEMTYETLLQIFWQAHDPTQGMRQGNDVGSQYRSGIYVYNDEQMAAAISSRAHYQKQLKEAGNIAIITTEIIAAPEFYYAEDYHQQYLAKNPSGYCGLGGTGVPYHFKSAV